MSLDYSKCLCNRNIVCHKIKKALLKELSRKSSPKIHRNVVIIQSKSQLIYSSACLKLKWQDLSRARFAPVAQTVEQHQVHGFDCMSSLNAMEVALDERICLIRISLVLLRDCGMLNLNICK